MTRDQKAKEFEADFNTDHMTLKVSERTAVRMETFVGIDPGTPAAIDLARTHAWLNSLSGERLADVHRKLHILQLAHEANRWRSSETGYFDQVKTLLP